VLGLLHYRGTRSGRLTRQRRRRLSYHSLSFELSQTVACFNVSADRLTSTIVSKQQTEIPVVVGRRQTVLRIPAAELRQRTLITVNTPDPVPHTHNINRSSYVPSVYVFNAAALSKPGAVQHIATDLQSYGASVAVITETHFNSKHTDSTVGINGYTVYRRDRVGRRGGGVAVYVTSELQSSRWTPAIAAVNKRLNFGLKVEFPAPLKSSDMLALYK